MLRAELGRTELLVSKLAIGTGTHGWRHSSEQTRRGADWLAENLKAGCDLGVNFWDLADQYGSHAYARRALKSLDRGDIVIATKTDARDYGACDEAVSRFLKEIGTDYLDIVLLHGQSSRDWNARYRPAMDALSEAKEKGLVKAVGISSHGFEGLKVAAAEPWVDVILVRFNYASAKMDAPKEQVLPVLREAHARGKGIYAMKVLGCGSLTSDPEKAMKYVLDMGCIHAVTVGHTEHAQLRQNAEIVERLNRQIPEQTASLKAAASG